MSGETRKSEGGKGKGSSPPSVMRSLGAFFGHIAKGVRADVGAGGRESGVGESGRQSGMGSGQSGMSGVGAEGERGAGAVERQEISRTVEERVVVMPVRAEDGGAGADAGSEGGGAGERVVLRRTVIEEVEVRRDVGEG